MKSLKGRIGANPVSVSPFHHAAAGAPPTIIFHGKADKIVAYWSADAFATKMKAAGNRCELVGFDSQGHGFFYFGRKNGKSKEAVEAMDKFLVSIGFLQKKEQPKKDRKKIATCLRCPTFKI